MKPPRHRLPLRVASLLLALLAGTGCALRPPGIGQGTALRISEVASPGDPIRQASLRLVLDGLEADVLGQRSRAMGSYARALQVDSGNPYAYLALARHHADTGAASQVLEHLSRSSDLFSSEERDSPRVDVHLIGLRGVAMQLAGRREEADRLLAQAARIAPSVWADGRLTAQELR